MASHGESNMYSMYIAARFSQFKATFHMVQLLELTNFILGTPDCKVLVFDVCKHLFLHNTIEFTLAIGNIWQLLHIKTIIFISVPGIIFELMKIAT